jgi:hypothetical protein
MVVEKKDVMWHCACVLDINSHARTHQTRTSTSVMRRGPTSSRKQVFKKPTAPKIPPSSRVSNDLTSARDLLATGPPQTGRHHRRTTKRVRKIVEDGYAPSDSTSDHATTSTQLSPSRP